MSAHDLAQFLLGRIRFLGKIGSKGHQDAGGTEAALKGMMAAERGLQGGKSICRGRKPLYGSDVATFCLDGEGEAGAGGHSVDQDRACPADAMLATDVGPREPDNVTQCIGQERAWLDIDGGWAAIQVATARMAGAGCQTW